MHVIHMFEPRYPWIRLLAQGKKRGHDVDLQMKKQSRANSLPVVFPPPPSVHPVRHPPHAMPSDYNPLLRLVDVVAPFLPHSLSDPLYSLALVDLASLSSNPSQLVPLVLSLLAGYTAFLSLLSSARFALRTALALVKWGAVAAVVGAVYLGYNGAGTERGVAGGVQDAADYAARVGGTAYSLGRYGARYWFGSNPSSSSSSSWFSSNGGGGGGAGAAAARSRQAREQRQQRRRAASASAAQRDDDPAAAGAHAAQDFVGQAFSSVLEFFGSNNGPSEGAQPRQRRSRGSRAGSSPRDTTTDADSEGGGLSGFAWNLAMNRAKQAWDDLTGATDGSTAPAGGRTRGETRNRNRNR